MQACMDLLGVPAKAKSRDETDVTASSKEGLAAATMPADQSPSTGARLGRPCTPNDIVRVKTVHNDNGDRE